MNGLVPVEIVGLRSPVPACARRTRYCPALLKFMSSWRASAPALRVTGDPLAIGALMKEETISVTLVPEFLEKL